MGPEWVEDCDCSWCFKSSYGTRIQLLEEVLRQNFMRRSDEV